ncbi:MAG: hypothetical protein OEY20_17795 [Gemmatimonadota bacterium]|nr:hypothetical protein [Gemmatimonadota bacterium]MDH5199099.1 hypothetical protein [Gemmatimonadota bacterium]
MFAKRLLACIAVAGLACGGERAADDETARDLSLAPAESVATLSDMPAPDAAAPGTQQPAAPQTPAPRALTPPAARPAAGPAMLTAAEGTTLMLTANDTLTSRHNKRGETVTATLSADVTDARGRTVIPAGALVVGTITDIAPAESPGGQGRMVITYTTLEFGGNSYAIASQTDSLPTYMKGRGVTGGDAAKVGAATAVGAAVGGIIGKDVKGAVIGGAVGAAAGVGIAAATRDVDILLNAGDPIRIILTAAFERAAS